MARSILTVLVTVAGLIVSLALTVASLPWLLWAIGRAAVGDDAGYDRALASCPLNRYWDWVEGVGRTGS